MPLLLSGPLKYGVGVWVSGDRAKAFYPTFKAVYGQQEEELQVSKESLFWSVLLHERFFYSDYT